MNEAEECSLNKGFFININLCLLYYYYYIIRILTCAPPVRSDFQELFLKNFEQTTSKFNYTQYDKLLLIKQQITGKAAILVDSLDTESQT